MAGTVQRRLQESWNRNHWRRHQHSEGRGEHEGHGHGKWPNIHPKRDPRAFRCPPRNHGYHREQQPGHLGGSSVHLRTKRPHATPSPARGGYKPTAPPDVRRWAVVALRRHCAPEPRIRQDEGNRWMERRAPHQGRSPRSPRYAPGGGGRRRLQDDLLRHLHESRRRPGQREQQHGEPAVRRPRSHRDRQRRGNRRRGTASRPGRR